MLLRKRYPDAFGPKKLAVGTVIAAQTRNGKRYQIELTEVLDDRYGPKPTVGLKLWIGPTGRLLRSKLKFHEKFLYYAWYITEES